VLCMHARTEFAHSVVVCYATVCALHCGAAGSDCYWRSLATRSKASPCGVGARDVWRTIGARATCCLRSVAFAALEAVLARGDVAAVDEWLGVLERRGVLSAVVDALAFADDVLQLRRWCAL
jgi:hypothetical protein